MKPCRHTDHVEGCRLCWLARYDAVYREQWGILGAPEPVPAGSPFKPTGLKPSRPPCVHLGDPLTGNERQVAGLPHLRAWRRCGLGHGEMPGVVCTCFAAPKGCKGCPDYTADGG